MLQSDKDLSVTTLPIHPCLDGWRQRVGEAIKRGGFLNNEMDDASSWNMCAVGESRKKYPKLVKYTVSCGRTDMPIDHTLKTLGYQFNRMVQLNEYKVCYLILDEIEERLNELLMEHK